MEYVEGSHCSGQKDGRNHRPQERRICRAAEDLVEGVVNHEEVVEEGGRISIVPDLDDC
jgi:hypothetical protein